MKFQQGTKVMCDGIIIGTVAGEFDPSCYPGIVTILVTPEYREITRRGWLWEDWSYGSGPPNSQHLSSVCAGKYCYNMRISQLQSCTTKLGNEL